MSTRDQARAARHYAALLAQARTVQVTAEHYVALAAEVRASLAAEVPITEADYLPRGYVARDSDGRVF